MMIMMMMMMMMMIVMMMMMMMMMMMTRIAVGVINIKTSHGKVGDQTMGEITFTHQLLRKPCVDNFLVGPQP